MNRLFVPLNGEHYENFASGEKDTELRGYSDQYNMKTVYPGRTVELRRGYSTGDSLWGVIAHVNHFEHLSNIPEEMDHRRILPDSTKEEFLDSASRLLNGYSTYIAFKVRINHV